jgi:peptidoglycan-N-acetylglucosamine deacetylase
MKPRGDLATRRQGAARTCKRRRTGAYVVLLAALAVAVGVGLGLRPGTHAARVPVFAPRAAAPGHGASSPAAPHPAGVTTGRIAPARPGRARVVVSGTPGSDQVALTFDDGFCASCVRRIVDVLWRTGVHATIFPNGVYARAWVPEAPRIRAMIARGQLVVGNHTYMHNDALRESPDAFARDLAANENWIERTFGVSARPWFRPPYGAYDGELWRSPARRGSLG